MPTPTMSVRAPAEHHQLIRRMARALMDRPELAESLTALIEGATQDVPQEATRPSAAVDQRFEDIERRLAQVEGQGVLRGEDLDVLLATQDVLQPIRERMDNAEEFLQRLMNMAEKLSDRVKDLERPEDLQHTIAIQPHRHTAPSKRRPATVITDDLHRQILDLKAQGLKRHEIVERLKLSDGTVSKYWKLPRPAD